MATVYTPAGETLEGVTGQLLDYYRGEGYRIVEDGEVPVSPVPVVEQPAPVEQPSPAPAPAPVPVEPVQQPQVDGLTAQ